MKASHAYCQVHEGFLLGVCIDELKGERQTLFSDRFNFIDVLYLLHANSKPEKSFRRIPENGVALDPPKPGGLWKP
ncbi:hypothetical protein CCP2SC5_870010 [Azospirillaceae bacterium]